jgi:TatA/E family protein of Tat protein translocase
MFFIGLLSFQDLIVIFLILLLVFGAKRMPEIGRAMGKTLSEFRKGLKEAEDEVKKAGEAEPEKIVKEAENQTKKGDESGTKKE